MENLHPADGMLDGYPCSGMLPVMLFLRGGEFDVGVFLGFPRPFMWQVYFGFITILFLRSLKTEIKPYIHLVKPFVFGGEYLFHERVIVDATGDEAEEKEDLSLQGRDGERLEREVFFFPL